MTRTKFLLILTTSLTLLISCKKDSNINERNRWIKDVMEEVYLWEENIPSGLNADSYDDSYVFFKKFLYKEDKWSWLSDDYYETSDMLDGITTTAGYEFSLYYREDNYHIKGIIEYVMPESPASAAGIKRGDVFTRINETVLNTDNYYSLLTIGKEYTIGFDTMANDSLIAYKEIALIEVQNFQENPIHVDTVYSIAGKQIAYLMYNSFIDKYNEDLNTVFNSFKSEGVTDLIIDLRYNHGGDVSAEEHLANLIAPSSMNGEIFSKDHWNTLLTDYFMDEKGDDFFFSYIDILPANINLSGKMYGLTSSSTASASEGLLNGLDPLVDLTLIGDTTHGKYTGMIVIPDDEDNPVWAIVPIVVKTTNKEDISVRGGMIPNTLLNDNPLDGYQLGDIKETMLAKAIEDLTGVSTTKSTKVHYQIREKSIGHFKNGKRLKPLPRIVGDGSKLLINY